MIRIGHLAKKILSKGGKAGVMGKTSRGIYLSTPNRWVVFCSWERFCSPMTIIVDGNEEVLERVAVGMGVQFEADQLSIPNAGLILNVGRSLEWVPKKPIEKTTTFSDHSERLDSLKRKLASIKGRNGDIREVVSSRELVGDKLGDALCHFLGAGQGLTPSGDDFVSGFLLAVNRYKHPPWSRIDLESLNRQCITVAYQKTTRLSANLIEMATWGESDERLLNAVDYIFGVDYALENVAEDLSTWGHSSGVAGLEGMGAAIENSLIG